MLFTFIDHWFPDAITEWSSGTRLTVNYQSCCLDLMCLQASSRKMLHKTGSDMTITLISR